MAQIRVTGISSVFISRSGPFIHWHFKGNQYFN
jgi:hypothetical protein